MKSKIFLFVLTAFLSFTNFSIQAADKYNLRLNLEKGSSYEMAMDFSNIMDQEIMGTPVKISQIMQLLVLLEVEDVLDNGNYSVKYGYKSVKVDMDAMGQKMSFDSEKDENSPLFASLGTLMDKYLIMELTPKGKVENIEGFDTFIGDIANNPQLQSSLEMFSSQEAFESSFSQSFGYFPIEDVEIGDLWEVGYEMPSVFGFEVKMDYELENVTDNTANLLTNSIFNSEGPIEMNGVTVDLDLEGIQEGKMQIDMNDGMMQSSDMNQKLSFTLTTDNPQTGGKMQIPMEFDLSTKISVVKTQ